LDQFSWFLENLLSKHFNQVYKDKETDHIHVHLNDQFAMIDSQSLEVNSEDKNLKKRLELLLSRALSCFEPL
jgi:hypothetical protein